MAVALCTPELIRRAAAIEIFQRFQRPGQCGRRASKGFMKYAPWSCSSRVASCRMSFRSPSKLHYSSTQGAQRDSPLPVVPIASTNVSTSKVVVIDNYDSFTYNLCQYLGDLQCEYDVFRNDEITIDELKERQPRGIVISPGPGEPKDSGISLESIVQLGSYVPILGVCMGLQCIGEAFGGRIVRAPNGVMHGKTSKVYFDEQGVDGILAGLPNPFVACRYHSLVIESDTFPSDELEMTAWTEDGLIMGIRHRKYKHIQAVQFHPESIITPQGKTIISNFLKILNQMDGGDGVQGSHGDRNLLRVHGKRIKSFRVRRSLDILGGTEVKWITKPGDEIRAQHHRIVFGRASGGRAKQFGKYGP